MKHHSRTLLAGLGIACLMATPTHADTPDCSAAKAAVATQTRTGDDAARDAQRKPAEVVCFLGISNGSRVLDLFSGGGYYTEIVSYLVGASGGVTAHNNKAYLDFAKDQIAERYKEGRLANVTHLHAEANALELDADTFDTAMMILAYHDIYYITEDDSWPTIDGPKLLASIMHGLKPGGVLGVVDHVAEAGAPVSVGTTLHRIDPALLRREIEAAGFIFDGQSTALRNPEDDHTKPMFDPSIQGHTDRVIYRFRKP